jgi:hypothetical protein
MTRGIPWRSVAAVLAVMAFLTWGWQLIGRSLSDDAPIARGTRITVGPETAESATTVVAGDGWSVIKSDTDPDLRYELADGDLTMALTFVELIDPVDVTRLWSGARQLASISDSEVGDPRPITTTAGVAGQTGTLRDGDRFGTLTYFVAPSMKYAVRITVLGPEDVPAGDRAEAAATVLATYFPEQP